MRIPTIILLLALSTAAQAADPDAASAPPPASAAKDPIKPSCVDVEINGYRGLSYNCLTDQMTPKDNAPKEAPGLASDGVTRLPPNQAGLANRASTANRMGNTFGKSVYPQRPAPPVYTSPLPGR